MHNAAVLDGRYSIDFEVDQDDDDTVKVSSAFRDRCGFFVSDYLLERHE